MMFQGEKYGALSQKSMTVGRCSIELGTLDEHIHMDCPPTRLKGFDESLMAIFFSGLHGDKFLKGLFSRACYFTPLWATLLD